MYYFTFKYNKRARHSKIKLAKKHQRLLYKSPLTLKFQAEALHFDIFHPKKKPAPPKTSKQQE